jgi:hypothetical protein
MGMSQLWVMALWVMALTAVDALDRKSGGN